jgi:hypothetical protein
MLFGRLAILAFNSPNLGSCVYPPGLISFFEQGHLSPRSPHLCSSGTSPLTCGRVVSGGRSKFASQIASFSVRDFRTAFCGGNRRRQVASRRGARQSEREGAD